MPNTDNVTSPIVIVGAERSGTSLLSSLFERHPDFSYEGEVANLIFGVWSSAEVSLNGMPELLEGGSLVTPEERAGRAVRSSFLSLCPNTQKNWCIKPIGVPRALTDRYGKTEWDQAAAYYWKVMKRSFPTARYIAVLRHPCDVVISSCSRWGHDPKTIWWSLGFMAYILAHKSAPKLHAVSFEALVGKGEAEIKAIMAALSVPFYPELLGALTEQHATGRDLKAIKAKRGFRRDQWDSLLAEDLPHRYRSALNHLFKRYRQPRIEWPKHLQDSTGPKSGPTGAPATAIAPEAEINRLSAIIADLNRAMDEANLRSESALLEQSRRFDQIWREQQDYLGSLSEAITWHEKQTATLAVEQESLQKQLSELQARNQKLAGPSEELALRFKEAERLLAEQALWNDFQLGDARAEIDALKAEIDNLRGWNDELIKAKNWQAAQTDTFIAKFNQQKEWGELQEANSQAAMTSLRAELAKLRDWNAELIKAKDWQAAQKETLEAEVREATQLAAEQKRWHEQQLANAQAAAGSLLAERAKLRDWNAKLVKANDWHIAQSESSDAEAKEAARLAEEQKRWHEQQLASVQAAADTLRSESQKLREWNAELIKAKDWQAAQKEIIEAQAREAARLADEQKLWLEQQLANSQIAADSLRTELAKLRDWNDVLAKAKDWHVAQNEALLVRLNEAAKVFQAQQDRIAVLESEKKM